MSAYFLSGRAVEVTEVSFELGEGATVLSAHFKDTEQDLTDSELDRLTDIYQSDLYQSAYEDMASRAYDRAKDAMKYGDL